MPDRRRPVKVASCAQERRGAAESRLPTGEPPQLARSGPTPLAWRVASFSILAGGALAGWAAAGSLLAWAAVASLPAVAAIGAVRVAVASRRVRPVALTSAGTEGVPDVTVLIPARNEVGVIGALIRDLSLQDHRDGMGIPKFDVIVIDDRSTDGTGAAARRAADELGIGEITRVVRRDDAILADGKAAALAAVPPEACREVIVVLDADARVAPGFLGLAATSVADGVQAAQARRRVLGATTSRLARLQADEQTVDGLVQGGRWVTGGCSEYRGNGMVIRRDVLVAAGGWYPGCLTEDLDLSSRVAVVTGCGVASALDLEVWESPVDRLAELWPQRLRWAEGSSRRYLEHGPAVLRSRRLSSRARLDFAIYGGQLLAPPLMIGLAGGAVAEGRAVKATIVLATYGITALGLAYDALRSETGPAGRPLARRARTVRAAQAAAFEGLWIAVVPVALWRLATRRAPLRFTRTPHRTGPFMDLSGPPRSPR